MKESITKVKFGDDPQDIAIYKWYEFIFQSVGGTRR